jgi:hypothetical protein
MRRSAALLSGLVIALGVAVAPAGASTTVLQHTQVQDGTYTYQTTLPGSEEPGTATDTFHGVMHEFFDASGGYHLMLTENGTTSFVPTDPTAPTFTGTFNNSTHINGPAQTLGGETTSLLNSTGYWSNGTPGTLHQLEHITTNANGVTTVSFSNLRYTS